LNAGKLTSKKKRREKVKMREISTMVYKRLMRLKKEENHVRDQDGGAALSNADFRDILSQKKRKTVFKSQIGRLLDRKINESFPLSKIEKKAAKQMKSKLARAMQKITPG